MITADPLHRFLSALTPLEGSAPIAQRMEVAPLRAFSSVFWNASAGFDFSPLIAAVDGRLSIDVTAAVGPHPLYVMTDYGAHLGAPIRDLMGNGLVALDAIDPAPFCSLVTSPTARRWWLAPIGLYRLFSAEQMTALQARMDPLMGLNHRAVVGPDQHIAAFWLDHSDAGSAAPTAPTAASILVLHAAVENAVFWSEVLAAFEVGVTVFCATGVGGKSGSWDLMHDRDGHLFRAIETAAPALRPRIWITDGTPHRFPKDFVFRAQTKRAVFGHYQAYRTPVAWEPVVEPTPEEREAEQVREAERDARNLKAMHEFEEREREQTSRWLAGFDRALETLDDEACGWVERCAALKGIDRAMELALGESFRSAGADGLENVDLSSRVARLVELLRRPLVSWTKEEIACRKTLARLARLTTHHTDGSTTVEAGYPDPRALRRPLSTRLRQLFVARNGKTTTSGPDGNVAALGGILFGMSMYDFHVEVPVNGFGVAWTNVFVKDGEDLVALPAFCKSSGLIISCPRCGQDVFTAPDSCAAHTRS